MLAAKETIKTQFLKELIHIFKKTSMVKLGMSVIFGENVGKEVKKTHTNTKLV